jgi:hypothetical protein
MLDRVKAYVGRLCLNRARPLIGGKHLRKVQSCAHPMHRHAHARRCRLTYSTCVDPACRYRNCTACSSTLAPVKRTVHALTPGAEQVVCHGRPLPASVQRLFTALGIQMEVVAGSPPLVFPLTIQRSAAVITYGRFQRLLAPVSGKTLVPKALRRVPAAPPRPVAGLQVCAVLFSVLLSGLVSGSCVVG